MRILAITNLYPSPLFPHRGTFNRQQFRALAAKNEMRVIVPISWTDERRALRRGAAPLSKNRQSMVDGLQVFHPRYIFPPRFFRGTYGRCFLRSIEAAFSEIAREFHPEVILAAWAYPDGWAAVEFGRRIGVPVVVKVHGSDILTLADVPGRRRGTAHAMQHADAVIAVSRDLAGKVTAMGAGPENISVIYDGIDCERFCPGSREDARKKIGFPGNAPLLLLVGNLLPVKGVDLLVDACAMLKSRGQDFRCMMIGEGPMKSALQAQIAAKNLTENVQLAGAIPHAQLPDYFRAADVFILPSRSEGVPCVLLEAAACQTPFVATRVGGIPEIAHLNTGELVESESAGAIADAVLSVLTRDRRSIAPYVKSHADAAREIQTVLESVAPKKAISVSASAAPLATLAVH